MVADLTEVHDVELRLSKSEKLASLGRVVEGVAHEVRNCLTSLGGFSRRLQKMNAGNLTAERYTQIILDNVARLEKMVRDIEEYSYFSKSYSFRLGSVALPEVIEKARTRVTDQISQSHSDAVSFKRIWLPMCRSSVEMVKLLKKYFTI